MIESILILPLSLLFLIYACQVMIYLSVELSIDDALEDLLFCKIQNKWTCDEAFKQHLSHLPLVDSKYNIQKLNDTQTLKFEAMALKIFEIKKTRTLNYSLQIL